MTMDTISLLMIENEEHTNSAAIEALERAGYNVISFSQSDIGNLHVLLEAHKWDLIIADIDTNDFNLLATLKVINGNNSDIPLIITGQNITEDYSIAAMEAGAQDYFSKGNINRLLPIVKRELRNIEKQRRLSDTVSKNQILNHILENSINEVYLLDPITLKFEFANQTLLKNLGYSAEELYGLQKSQIVDSNYEDKTQQLMAPLLQGETHQVSFKSIRKRKNGTTYPVEVYLEEVKQLGQHYLLGIGFDVSQRTKDAETIKRQQAQTRRLELNNKYKSEFFANLSHEMRTTLNSVSLLSQILIENEPKNLTQEQLDYTELIHRSNNSLLELLNEVLDLSKIEAGKVNARIQDVPVCALTEQLLSLFKPLAREKKLQLELNRTESGFINIKTDQLRLEQILKNLLSNALKFTHNGSIQLNVFQPSTQKLHQLNIEATTGIAFQVVDTGIGIPEQKQRMIFQSYVQANGAGTEQQFGGTGLGLAISQKLAHILGGKLMLESEVGKGSTFTLFLPEDATQALEQEAQKGTVTLQQNMFENETAIKSLPLPKTPKKRGSVLLVDDSKIHNMALKEFLGFKIKDCYTAESAKEAYQILDNQTIDCIILDMYLPDADGKEVLMSLQSDPTKKDIPVIVYSGKSLTEKEEKELSIYATAIVQKNVQSYRMLMEKVASIIYG
jgi:two-component system chemotaxis sensor kinase CheA